MIYQELSLAPHLTVAENIFLGREPLKFPPLGLIDGGEVNRGAKRLLEEFGFKINPRARVR